MARKLWGVLCCFFILTPVSNWEGGGGRLGQLALLLLRVHEAVGEIEKETEQRR